MIAMVQEVTSQNLAMFQHALTLKHFRNDCFSWMMFTSLHFQYLEMFISPADRLRFVLAAEALGDRPADRPPSPDHPVVIRGGEGDKW